MCWLSVRWASRCVVPGLKIRKGCIAAETMVPYVSLHSCFLSLGTYLNKQKYKLKKVQLHLFAICCYSCTDLSPINGKQRWSPHLPEDLCQIILKVNFEKKRSINYLLDFQQASMSPLDQTRIHTKNNNNNKIKRIQRRSLENDRINGTKWDWALRRCFTIRTIKIKVQNHLKNHQRKSLS